MICSQVSECNPAELNCNSCVNPVLLCKSIKLVPFVLLCTLEIPVLESHMHLQKRPGEQPLSSPALNPSMICNNDLSREEVVYPHTVNILRHFLYKLKKKKTDSAGLKARNHTPNFKSASQSSKIFFQVVFSPWCVFMCPLKNYKNEKDGQKQFPSHKALSSLFQDCGLAIYLISFEGLFSCFQTFIDLVLSFVHS